MKEEKESIFSFRRKSSHRLSLHLDRKKEKKEDGQLKRASWSSFPLLRFSSSPSSSSSSSPATTEKRSFGRKCSSSEEIKSLGNKYSPSKGNFQRGSNASIRSSVSTSSASSSSSVRTGGSSSITSILEGSGSDTLSCESYGGNTSNRSILHTVSRTHGDLLHPKRYEHRTEVTRKDPNESASLPYLEESVGRGDTSPRIVYAHLKTPDMQHRSRKQLVKELDDVRRTGSLPQKLELKLETPRTETKSALSVSERAKSKHKKSFNFIHNSRFLGRLEARTKREAMCEDEENEVELYYEEEGCNDKQVHTTSCHKPLVIFQHPETTVENIDTISQGASSPRITPSPSPRHSPKEDHRHHASAINVHLQYNHESSSPSPQSHLRLPEHTQHHIASPVTILKSPPPPPFLNPAEGQASPPQYSLTAFLNEAFGTSRSSTTSSKETNGHLQPTLAVNTTKTNASDHNEVNTTFTSTFSPILLETNLDSRINTNNTNGHAQPVTNVNAAKSNTQEINSTKPTLTSRYLETDFDAVSNASRVKHHQTVTTNTKANHHQHQLNTFAETLNPRYLETRFEDTRTTNQNNTQAFTQTTTSHRNQSDINNRIVETYNPRYLETDFDSTSSLRNQHSQRIKPPAIKTYTHQRSGNQVNGNIQDTYNSRYVENEFDNVRNQTTQPSRVPTITTTTHTQHDTRNQVNGDSHAIYDRRYIENGFESIRTQNTQSRRAPTSTYTQQDQENSGYTETFNPGYLETSFDSPSDFVIERNFANLIPEVRNIYHHVLFKGKDPHLPLSRSEFGELELKQNFLGVIGDTIEEEEEEEEEGESDSEIGDLMCQVDSTCFERTMEDKLEEMAGSREDEYVETIESTTTGEVKEEEKEKKKKTELKLQLVKPENKMVKRVQRGRLLRHISEESESFNSAGEEEVEMRTPSTPRSPAIDIDNAFEMKHREIDEDTDEMSRLRDLTKRLQLTTRRPSYLNWATELKERGKKVGEALATHSPTVLDKEEEEEEEKEEDLSMNKRKHNLQTAVDWVRKELTDMRQQDQQLARQLLQLHVEVQRLRLLHSCLATSCLIDEGASGAAEARMMETSDLCDLPPDLRETFSPVLREMGLTRMNITSRRFSLR